MGRPPRDEHQDEKMGDASPRAIRYTDAASKSLYKLKLGQPQGHNKIIKIINSLTDREFPVGLDITRMKGTIHGHTAYAARVKGRPEYYILFQTYAADHVDIEDVMTAQHFHSRFKNGVG